MRARYYSPELRRFINADIIAGAISEAITLNRYAYANGNPVSNVDPFGLEVDKLGGDSKAVDTSFDLLPADVRKQLEELYDIIGTCIEGISAAVDNIYYAVGNILKNASPEKMGVAAYSDLVRQLLDFVSDTTSPTSKVATFLDDVSVPWAEPISVAFDVTFDIYDNIEKGEKVQYIVSDAVVECVYSVTGVAIGAMIGSVVVPGLGTVAGFVIGVVVDVAYEVLTETPIAEGKSFKDWAKDSWRNVVDFFSGE